MWFLFLFIMSFATVTSFPPMEDPNLFEGDMILTPDQLTAIKNGEFNRDLPLAATRRPWPKLIAYDLFGLKTIPKARKVIEDAFRDYHKHTCLRFIPRTNERAYLQFYEGGGCSSRVGYWGGKNTISLGKACWTKNIAIHEIMHSLGFHHEQSRPDRDKYVKILMENVLDYAKDNFNKYGNDRIDSLGSPYDFSSVMHYNDTTFAKHGTKTILTVDPKNQKLLGKKNGLSKQDIYQINKLYKCADEKPMTIPVIPTLDPSCSDTYAHCDRYDSYCKSTKSDSLTRWVKKSCRKQCNFC
ncbi:zinc metalloproteinase nas-6-like [Hydractinia symbiolongicarpus]|uniref:zinc metalloproteinase nas-6-like n=1 Tax=Hydractinia symbiolongicarpus TaxID=13093 RepID=UPI00254DB9A4|nr:zinc metalloproteinase nas-6-like [Hydractinia symbiolongicarpus]XP_057302557.1 zinc metalloproteinase nas-6-like [Hydractinia symbiolongicarpus]